MNYVYRFIRDGESYNVNTESGTQKVEIQYKGYHVYHPYDPEKDTERVLASINHNYHNNYVIFGMRNSLLIEGIIKRMSDYSTLTIVEFDVDETDFEIYGSEVYANVFNNSRIKLIYQKIDDLIVSASTTFKGLLFDNNLRNTHILVCPYIRSLYPKELKTTLTAIFERLYSQIAGYGNAVEDTLWGIDNLFNNWDVFCKGKPSHLFKDSFEKVPVIIVGAGPSLDENIDILKRLQGKALIFAVDAAVKKLISHGIRMDAITTIERTEEPLLFYEGIGQFSDEVFVGPNIIVKDILNKFDRRIFSGRLGDGVFMSLNNYIGNDNIDVGLSVANVLFAYARLLGCDPIILVGVDLAYIGGKTHISDLADSLPEELANAYRDNVTTVLGVNGDVLETYEYFVYTKVWLEKHMHLDKSRKYYNCTKGGAYITGAEHVSLEDVELFLKDRECLKTRLKEIYDKVKNRPEYDLEITEKAREFNDLLIDALIDLKELSADCKKDVERDKQGRVERIVKSRGLIDEKLIANDAMRFLMQPIFMSYFRDMHAFPIFLDSEAEEGLYKRSLHYYSTIGNVIDKILDSFDVYNTVLSAYNDHFRRQYDKELN